MERRLWTRSFFFSDDLAPGLDDRNLSTGFSTPQRFHTAKTPGGISPTWAARGDAGAQRVVRTLTGMHAIIPCLKVSTSLRRVVAPSCQGAFLFEILHVGAVLRFVACISER